MPATPAELFERHHLVIYRYLLRMTGSREEAEELTQEVFLRVLKAHETYEERDRERAWLFRIARNLRRDRGRQERRVPPASPLDHVEATTPGQQLLRLTLLGALSDLPDEDREMFVMAEIGGLTYAEIAAVCDTTTTAVRSRIYRARLALRAALDSDTERVVMRGSHAYRS